MASANPLGIIESLGNGVDPGALGVQKLDTGYLDLRWLKLPRAQTLATARLGEARIEYRPGRPSVAGCNLSKTDFAGSDLGELTWESPYTLEDVKMDRIQGRHQCFRPGLVRQATFRRADLRDSHWGVSGKPGPTWDEVDFEGANLRGSTFGHPLFRGCRFGKTKLDGIDFNGSRFEDCVFQGPMRDVWFHGKGRGKGPDIQDLRNPMKNVDFTKADLQFVEFLDGADLTTCRFPERGYIRIRHPKRVFQLVRGRVASWKDKGRDEALKYVGYLVDYHFAQEVPLYVMRPEDLSDHRNLRGVGARILQELEAVLQEQSSDSDHIPSNP